MHLWASYLQISQRDFAISNIVIDVFDVLARLNLAYVPDDLVIPQLSDDKIPLDVRIRIGRMSDLERKLGQGETSILGPSSDPVNVGIVRWPIGVEPKFCRSPGGLNERHIQSPESNVMTLSWAAINCFLEADVLTTTEKIKGAEWGGWVRRVKYKCSDHSP